MLLDLPANETQVETGPGQPALASVVAPGGNVADPVRVLLADDYLFSVDVLEETLAADEEVEVVGRAHNGKEAVEMAMSLQPDLIVMDMNLPVLDGVEATLRLREDRSYAGAITLIGSGSPVEVILAKVVGATRYTSREGVADDVVRWLHPPLDVPTAA